MQHSRVGAASRHILDSTPHEVFYAFFHGWRYRHGLPEMELTTKQQQLVARSPPIGLMILMFACRET